MDELAKGGSAIDAVLAGYFAAAGHFPGVLLGPVTLLLGRGRLRRSGLRRACPPARPWRQADRGARCRGKSRRWQRALGCRAQFQPWPWRSATAR
jgi:hypothetical protein